MHKNVCMAGAMLIMFCCYLVDFFFKDSQLYCLEQLCRLKKKKRKRLVLGLSMPYCCKNRQDELVPANMLYLEMPAMKLVANQEAKTERRVAV